MSDTSSGKELRLVRPKGRTLDDDQERLAVVTFTDVLNGRYDEVRVFFRNGKIQTQPMDVAAEGERA